MKMRPLSNSTMRSSAVTNELLPAPVRPTMPTFSRGLISKVMPAVMIAWEGDGGRMMIALIGALATCNKRVGQL